MPTPNFTLDNTAPAAVALASLAYDNTAPAGVAVATGAYDNGAPVAVALANMAGTVLDPVAVPRGSQTPDNTAPAGVTVGTPAFDNTPPATVTRPDQTPSNAAPAAIARADQTPSNGAPSTIARPDQTPADAAPGAVAIPASTGTASTPQPIGYTPPLGPLSDATMQTPTLNFAGNLALNQIFGYYVAPAACVVKGVQLSAQKAPLGADAIITLVDADGISLGRTATLPSGQTTANITFNPTLPLLNAATVRAKVTQIGTGNNPGAFLTANLIVQLGS